jgi:hypothetical protein
MKTNLQKKKKIDQIVVKYKGKFAELKKKRNKVVANFVETLKQKRLEEVKDSLKNL